jgi:hypothetical protein
MSVTNNGTVFNVAVIGMATGTGLCADFQSNSGKANEAYLWMNLTDFDGAHYSVPTAPGTYTVTSGGTSAGGKIATILTYLGDASCNAGVSANGVSGTVTLTEVNGLVFAGTFDATLDNASADHITGSFTPSACPALSTLPSGPGTCI